MNKIAFFYVLLPPIAPVVCDIMHVIMLSWGCLFLYTHYFDSGVIETLTRQVPSIVADDLIRFGVPCCIHLHINEEKLIFLKVP